MTVPDETIAEPPALTPTGKPALQSVRSTTFAAAIGNTIEAYDYAVFGFLAVVFGKVFFPNATPGAALLSAFAVFGAAFVMRPLGAVIFGNIADRLGRRPTLLISILGMGVVTTLVGLLPSAATIGIGAPILLVLLRFLQGLSAAGEYSTATIYAAEFAPAHRKGEMASWVQAGSLAGLLLGALIVLGLNAALSPADMVEWGWRVPFLLALPLGAVGLWLRSRLGETPEFIAAKLNVDKPPVTDRRALRTTLFIGIGILQLIGFYVVFTYVQNLIIQLGFNAVQATLAVAVAIVIGAGLVVLGGRVSDRIGRRPALLGTALVVLLTAYPLFSALSTATSLWGVIVCAVLIGAAPSFYSGITTITFIELFPVHARGRAVSLAYSVTAAVFGGTAVYLCQLLVQATGNNYAPSFLLMVAAVVSGAAALGLRAVLPARASEALPASSSAP